MYAPKPFAFPEGALSEMHDLIEDQAFGILSSRPAARRLPPTTR